MVVTGFDIFNKHVGDGAPCFIVAEVAQGHHGSYDLAHAFIDAIADAGADAVKFQRHLADEESWPDEPWRVKPRWGSETRFEYWRRMEFSPAEWVELWRHAHDRGLAFILSAFSAAAVTRDDLVCPDAWKVASGEVGSRALILAMLRSGVPLIVSTGMSTWLETVELQQDLRRKRDVVWLHCRSLYPTPPDSVGLHGITAMNPEGSGLSGLSDHSGSIWPSIAAVMLDAALVEVHVKLSDYDPGPDASSSITVPQLKQLVEGVRFIEAAKRPIDKDAVAKELAPMRALFMERAKRRADAQVSQT